MKKFNFNDRKVRIALLSAPMFLLPLALLAFTIWSGMDHTAEEVADQLNTSIPQVQHQENLDQVKKISVYENQPIAKDLYSSDIFLFQKDSVPASKDRLQSSKINTEKLIEEQLRQLEMLEQELSLPPKPSASEVQTKKGNATVSNPEIERLEILMSKLDHQRSLPDQELIQLDAILDKILQLQFPETFDKKVVTQAAASMEVLPANHSDFIHQEEENGFFGISELSGIKSSLGLSPAIPAVVDETKKIISGNSLRLQLKEPIAIDGLIIPADARIYGTCRLEGERLMIQVEHIRYENYLLPVQLEAFGMDAIKGLHIPGALGREAAKEGMDRGVQGINPMMGGLTLETQLAAGGIDTARGFLSKKARLKKVHVKQGHPMLLVNNS